MTDKTSLGYQRAEAFLREITPILRAHGMQQFGIDQPLGAHLLEVFAKYFTGSVPPIDGESPSMLQSFMRAQVSAPITAALAIGCAIVGVVLGVMLS